MLKRFLKVKAASASFWLSRNKAKLEKFIFWALIFFLPTQLGKHFWPPFSFVFGIKIDYLSPTVYFTDILVLLLLVLSAGRFRKYSGRLVLLISFVFLNIFFAQNRLLAAVKWLKVGEFIFLGWYVYSWRKLVLDKTLVWILAASILFVSFLGIGQFLAQRSIGGLFYFLGERTFMRATPGIALVSLFGREFLRSYSTFSHPNSLAGFIMVGSLLLTALNKKLKAIPKKTFAFFSVIVALALILTFSAGVFIALALVIGVYFFRLKTKVLLPAIICSLILPILAGKINFGGESVQLRLQQAEIAGRMFSQNPFFGIGLNNFISSQRQNLILGTSLFLQPVHNLFLLVLTETGIFGLLGFSLIFYWILKKCRQPFLSAAILLVVFTGLVDHYWLTLQQNELLLSLLLGLSLPWQKD
jgi:O-antigen ligase